MRDIVTGAQNPEINETLKRATIVEEGVLQAPHEWLFDNVAQLRSEIVARPTQKKILLLGSGLVAGPAVEVFASRPDVHLVIGKSSVRVSFSPTTDSKQVTIWEKHGSL